VIICSCNRVSDTDIQEAIDKGARSLKAIRKRTQLGTNCGSCLTAAKVVFDNHLKDRNDQQGLFYSV